ncbi:MAG: type I DNA topoisomerase [Gemmatimonadetes bacterium]|nr:type I DNA topoisomerase [Gemmatimonadota bacterium]
MAAKKPVARKKVARRRAATPSVVPKSPRPGSPAAAKAASLKAMARKKAARRAPSDDEGEGSSSGAALVIVESPAKAKTIGKYLGRGYRVKATVGHVRDLPTKKLGIDVENDFAPDYVTIEGKEKTLADLKEASKDASAIFLATDPDREGEAIAWHVAGQLRRKGGARVRRVLFHEITKDAVKEAIARAGDIDSDKVNAQQARRVLDRLVGYKASPLLWQTVKKGLSAGRVQTVALRLLVEREREIRAFRPVEYWTVEAGLRKGEQLFSAKLHHIDGRKPEIHDAADATRIVTEVRGAARAALSSLTAAQRTGEPAATGAFRVTDVKRRERRKNPAAPFTTSTLQQESAKKLGYGSKRAMRLAQDLYEGIELGPEGAVGLITYMRTDSTRVAESAAAQARDWLRARHGERYLAAGPQLYGTGKQPGRQANTQDAHEGIRPTDPARHPEQVQKFLSKDQFRLYQLVWQRFMASQMAPAVFDTTTLDFDLLPGRQLTHEYLFRSTGSIVKFDGFLALYRESREEGEGKALEDEQALPVIEPGESVPVTAVTPSQHFTEPPPRFSEASLVKELERLGIGRPSTYASIISTLVDRRYAMLEQRRFFPTPQGESVEKVMVKQFPHEFDVGFTALMEAELDQVEEGRLKWTDVLKHFWRDFEPRLRDVNVGSLIREAHDISRFDTERCPLDGGKLIPKGGFFGPFIACENHPKTCKFTRPLRDKPPAEVTPYLCHECGAPMLKRHGRSGDFLGCSRFPKCRGTRSMPTGVMCPKDGGEIAERRSKKRGKAFYGCSNYPDCDFVCWDRPVPEKCPECGYLGAEKKQTKARGAFRKCLKCANEWAVEEPAEVREAVVA